MHKELLWSTCSNCKNDTNKLVCNKLISLKPPYCLYLNGDVGAGKTWISKKLAEYYKVKNLISSSYLKFTTYIGDNNDKIIHADFFYMPDNYEFFFENIYDEVDDYTILLIEWATQILPLKIMQYSIDIKIKNLDQREIRCFRLI